MSVYSSVDCYFVCDSFLCLFLCFFVVLPCYNCMFLFCLFFFFFFFKQKTAYEIRLSLVGSEMCIRDRYNHGRKESGSICKPFFNSSPLLASVYGVVWCQKDQQFLWPSGGGIVPNPVEGKRLSSWIAPHSHCRYCLLYTSDAADE